MATTFAAISQRPGSARGHDRAVAVRRSTVATESLRVQQPFLVDLTTLGEQLDPGDGVAEDGAPGAQPGDRGGDEDARADADPEPRGWRKSSTALKSLVLAPGTEHGAQRPERDRRHAQPDGPLPRPVRDRVQRLELLVDVRGRAPLGADDLRLRPARHAQLRHPTSGAGVGEQGATTPVNGTSGSNSPPLTVFGGQQFLHAQSYGAAVDNHGNADCETGQRGYGRRSSTTSTRRAATSQSTPTPRAIRVPRSAGGLAVRQGGDVQPQSARPARSSPSTPRIHETADARRRRRISSFKAGLIGIVVIVLISYLVVHEVRQPARESVHGPRDLLERQRACVQPRWCGSPASTSARCRASSGVELPGRRRPASPQCSAADVTITIDKHGPAAPQGRDLLDPAPDLPRGELLRRRQPGNSDRRRALRTATRSRSSRG